MKKPEGSAKLILTVLIFLSFLVIGKTSFAGTLSVSAKGIVKFSPKNVKLTVMISSRGGTQKSALKKLRTKINLIAKSIKRIKTNYINVIPVNAYNFKLRKTVNNGYEGQEKAYIKFKINNLNKYVIYLLNIKNVQVQNIKYYDTSVLKYKIKAVTIAFKKALAKAKPLLGIMGKKIKDIESIKITEANAPVYRPFPFTAMGAAKVKTNKAIFPGKNKIAENVYIKIRY